MYELSLCGVRIMYAPNIVRDKKFSWIAHQQISDQRNVLNLQPFTVIIAQIVGDEFK